MAKNNALRVAGKYKQACIEYKYFALEDDTKCYCDNCIYDATQYGIAYGCTNGTGGYLMFDLYKNLNCMYNIYVFSVVLFKS